MNPLRVEKLRARIGAIEKEIDDLEESCGVLQLELSSVGVGHARRRRVIEELEDRQRRIQRHEDEWAELSEIVAAESH